MKEQPFTRKMLSALQWLYNNILYVIAGTAGVFACTITVCNVFARYILNNSYPGTEECVMICFAYVVFLGAAAAYREKMHYGIDVLVNLFPEKIKKGINIFTQILVSFSLIYITYLSFSYAISCINRTTSYARISYFWVILPMAVGFLFMTFYSFEDLIRSIIKKERSTQAGGEAE